MHKSKRLSLLIFSTSDIGSNIRLLCHAKSFSELNKSKVLILGPDITCLPKKLEKKNNIRQQYFHQFIQLPTIFSIIFYPLRMLFYSIELFIIAITYPSFDYCLVSYNESFFLSFLLSKWCHAKLIFDYPSLKWNKGDDKLNFLRIIEEKLLSFADIHICSTQSIQLVLKVRHIHAFVIHDPSRSLFQNQTCSNTNSQLNINLNKGSGEENSQQNSNDIHNNNISNKINKTDKIPKNDTENDFDDLITIDFNEKKKESFQILGIDQNDMNHTDHTFLCGIPLPFFEDSIMKDLLSIIDKLYQCQVSVFFVLFSNEKNEKTIKKFVENFHFSTKSASSSIKFISFHTEAYSFVLSCCDFSILFFPTVFGLEYSPQLSDLLSFQIPILAFKRGAICEAIKEGENGFIFKDTIELAKLLNKILIEKTIKIEKLRSFYSSPHFEKKWEIEWKKCFDSILGK